MLRSRMITVVGLGEGDIWVFFFFFFFFFQKKTSFLVIVIIIINFQTRLVFFM